MIRIRASLAWFVGALVVYTGSAARGPMWADSSKLALYALAGYAPSLNPGDHPGWTVLARVWLALTGWLGPIASLHLFSATCGALAVALAFMYASKRTSEPSRGHSAAAVLLVAHPIWWASSVTESYALAVVLVMSLALAVAARDSVARALVAGILVGLALATHAFTLFLTVPLLLALPRARAPLAAFGIALGSAPVWLGLFGTPADPLTGHVAGTLASWSWVFGAFLRARGVPAGVLTVAVLLAYALGPIGWNGILRVPRARALVVHPRPRIAACALVALFVLLAAYSAFRSHLMVGLVVAGVFLIAPPRLTARARAAHIAVQASLYLAAPWLLGAAGLGDLGVRQLPYRDNAWYFLCPIKTLERGPERYAREMFAAVPPGANVLADFNPGAVLALAQRTAHVRSDVRVVPTAIDEALGSADPAADLARRIEVAAASGAPVVLADVWEPYYRGPELARRFGLRSAPCGPGARVETPGRRLAVGKSNLSSANWFLDTLYAAH